MNDEIQTLIQAEIDGVATPEETARLETAAQSDPNVRALRSEYHDLATAISGMPAIEAPPGFTRRVMAALPEPRVAAAPSGVSIRRRIRDIVQMAVPRPRHRVAFAFALGVVVMLGINVLVGQIEDPGTDLVAGTMIGPGAQTLPLANGAGTVRIERADGALTVSVSAAEPAPIRVSVSGPAGVTPEVALEVSSSPVDTFIRDGVVVLSSDRTDELRFAVRGSETTRIRVESDASVLLDWTSNANDR